MAGARVDRAYPELKKERRRAEKQGILGFAGTWGRGAELEPRVPYERKACAMLTAWDPVRLLDRMVDDVMNGSFGTATNAKSFVP